MSTIGTEQQQKQLLGQKKVYWQDQNRDVEARKQMLNHVIHLMHLWRERVKQQRGPAGFQTWLARIPLVASQVDTALYWDASSLLQYTDASTLMARVRKLHDDRLRRDVLGEEDTEVEKLKKEAEDKALDALLGANTTTTKKVAFVVPPQQPTNKKEEEEKKIVPLSREEDLESQDSLIQQTVEPPAAKKLKTTSSSSTTAVLVEKKKEEEKDCLCSGVINQSFLKHKGFFQERIDSKMAPGPYGYEVPFTVQYQTCINCKTEYWRSPTEKHPMVYQYPNKKEGEGEEDNEEEDVGTGSAITISVGENGSYPSCWCCLPLRRRTLSVLNPSDVALVPALGEGAAEKIAQKMKKFETLYGPVQECQDCLRKYCKSQTSTNRWILVKLQERLRKRPMANLISYGVRPAWFGAGPAI